jgi:hypothetical protein
MQLELPTAGKLCSDTSQDVGNPEFENHNSTEKLVDYDSESSNGNEDSEEISVTDLHAASEANSTNATRKC